jgi:poly-gamma-glutamate synthesis protein (capsule biosynthesis protein)
MLGIGVHSTISRRGFKYLFEQVKENIKADLVFGNLETTLSDINFKPYDFHLGQLRGSPAMANVLKKSGFNIINIANNHMMQFGPKPFVETCQSLEKCGIKIVGLRGDGEWYSIPVMLGIKNTQIGFLGYADPDKYGHEPLFAINQRENVLHDVSKLRCLVDKVIVSLHWGDEFIRTPSPAQRRFANEMVGAGADIILGHHPHVIQEVESLRGAFICYSLGNFISDMVWNPRTREGLAMTFELTTEPVTLMRVEKAEIRQDFSPLLKPFSLEGVARYVHADVSVGKTQEGYLKLLRDLIRDNRNRGHFFLLLNVFSYSLSCYTQIWINSIRRLFCNKRR